MMVAKMLSKRKVKVPLHWVYPDYPGTQAKFEIHSKNLLKSFHLKHILIGILASQGYQNKTQADLLQLTRELFFRYLECIKAGKLFLTFLTDFDLLQTYQVGDLNEVSFILVLQAMFISLQEMGAGPFALDLHAEEESGRMASPSEIIRHIRMRNLVKCFQGPDDVIVWNINLPNTGSSTVLIKTKK